MSQIQPQTTSQLHYSSAKSLMTQLSKGTITSRQLLEKLIERIEHFNPHVNAIVAKDFDNARKRADEADMARANNENWGPLHGLPMTIKDTYEVVGMPVTAGSEALKNYLPKQNAVTVQRILDAGGIVIGKTNVPLFAGDLQSYNKVHGTTNNPWDLSRTPGGSSGGSAAALAAGFTPLELGSDIGGSIRTPAHYCGVYGLKTTHGIVTLRGHIPGPPGALSEPDLAVPGPLARTADDLNLLLDVIVGPAPEQAEGISIKLPPAKQKKLSDFKVLAWFDDELSTLDSEMRAEYQKLINVLKEQGASVSIGAPPKQSLADFYALYMNLLGSVMGASNKKPQRQILGLVSPLLKRMEDRFNLAPHLNQFLEGISQGHVDWLKKNEKRLRVKQRFLELFKEYDVILTPITPTAAIPHQHKPAMPLRSISVNGQKRSYTEHLIWISPATLMGLPAVSAPIAISSDNLPINVQIIAKSYHDKTAIRFASLLEKKIGGFTTPPGY